MGLGDFISGAAHSVGNWVEGAAEGVGTVVTHLDDVARGAAWAVNPTHYDDIARGVGNAAEYVGEHPGQIWDTGFEVGRYLVKDQLLDPKNLAINLAFGAAGLATAGGASGLLAARVANWSREGLAAVRGVRSLEEVASGARAIEGGIGAAEAIESATTAARGAGRVERFMTRADEVMQTGSRATRAARESVGLKPLSYVSRQRNALAATMAERGGVAGQILGQSVGVSTARPVIEGSRAGQAISDVMWLNRQKGRIESGAGTVSKLGEQGRDLTQAVNDPLHFGIRKANEHGYDPLGTVNSLAQKGMSKAAQKALKPKDKPRRGGGAYTDMTSGGGVYASSGAAVGAVGPAVGGGSEARVTGQGEETVSSQLTPTLGRRRSNFYAGTNQTYAGNYEEMEGD